MTVGSSDNVYKSWNPLSPLWLMIGNEHKDYVKWETFFFLRLAYFAVDKRGLIWFFAGQKHVYGCIHMVHVCMNLWLVTYLWSAHLFSFWCNSLFCAFCLHFQNYNRTLYLYEVVPCTFICIFISFTPLLPHTVCIQILTFYTYDVQRWY